MQGNRTSQCRIKIVNQCMKLALFSVHNIKKSRKQGENSLLHIFYEHRPYKIPSFQPTWFQNVIKIKKGDPTTYLLKKQDGSARDSVSTLYRITWCDDTKTIPDWIGHLFTNKNGNFGAIFVTEREFLHFPFSAITACHMGSHELILNIFVRPGKVPALVTLTKITTVDRFQLYR